jgi:hypothetical protein
MTARHWLTVLVALSASLAVTAAEAQSKKKGGGGVAARGCTHSVAPYCLGFTTTGGKTYALLDPSPWMPLGIGVSVSGTATDSPCGPAIRVSSWKADNTVKCRTR